MNLMWSSIPMRLLAGILLIASGASAADIPSGALRLPSVQAEKSGFQYRWEVLSLPEGAEILTLLGQFDTETAPEERAQDVPLVAVLRDSLGDDDSKNDRLRYVWLLTYARPNLGQRFLGRAFSLET